MACSSLIGIFGLLTGLLGSYLAPAAEASPKLGPGDVFKDCDTCPQMVVVPPGGFHMGDLNGGGTDWERPVHEVRIGYTLAIGRYEVTFAEWDACVSGGGCRGYRPSDRGWGRGHRPVIDVSWDDAKTYVTWLSDKTGLAYRLLSEAEWEHAARAGTKSRYSWGDSIGSENAYCNGCGIDWDDAKPNAAGRFRPNAFGLYDLHGSVWEWVEDCWHDSYIGAPRDGSAWTRGGECGQRVMRGGSWVSGPRNHRAAARGWDGRNSRLVVNGFRVARMLAK